MTASLTCDSYVGGADIVCGDDDIKLGALRLNESSSFWTISAATESHFQYHNYKATYCFDCWNVRHHEIGTCLISNMRSSSLSRFWTISSDLWTSWRLEAPQYKCFFPHTPPSCTSQMLHKSNTFLFFNPFLSHLRIWWFFVFRARLDIDNFFSRCDGDVLFIGPKSDHWLSLFTNSLADYLTAV